MRNIDNKSKEYQEGYWDGHNDATSISSWFYDPNGMDWNIGAWRCDHCGYRNSSLPNVENINPYTWASSKYCAECGRRMLPVEGECCQMEKNNITKETLIENGYNKYNPDKKIDNERIVARYQKRFDDT